MSRLFFGTLFEYDTEFNLLPQLVDHYYFNADQSSYIFELKPDLVWSDGNPITANDFRAGVLRAAKLTLEGRRSSRNIFTSINGFTEATDGKIPIDEIKVFAESPTRIRIEVERESDEILLKFGDFATGITPSHIIEKHGEDWTKHLVSSGPCLPVEIDFEKTVYCERNPNYARSEKVNVDGLEFWFASQENSSMRIAQEVDADIVIGVGSDVVSILQTIAPQQLYFEPANNVERINFNMANEKMQDERVRRAILLAFDIDSAVSLTSENTKRARSLLPNLTARDLPDMEQPISVRRELARELLDQAGYSSSKPLRVGFSSYQVRNKREYIKYLIRDLEHVGIIVDPLLHDQYKGVLEDTESGAADISLTAWGVAKSQGYEAFLPSLQQSEYGLNNLDRPDIEQRIVDTLAEPDRAKRDQNSIKIAQEFIDELYSYPVLTRTRTFVLAERVATPPPDTAPWFWYFGLKEE